MSGVDPSAAVAKQTKLAAEIFDELYNKTFDGVGVTSFLCEGEQVASELLESHAKKLDL